MTRGSATWDPSGPGSRPACSGSWSPFLLGPQSFPATPVVSSDPSRFQRRHLPGVARTRACSVLAASMHASRCASTRMRAAAPKRASVLESGGRAHARERIRTNRVPPTDSERAMRRGLGLCRRCRRGVGAAGARRGAGGHRGGGGGEVSGPLDAAPQVPGGGVGRRKGKVRRARPRHRRRGRRRGR